MKSLYTTLKYFYPSIRVLVKTRSLKYAVVGSLFLLTGLLPVFAQEENPTNTGLKEVQDKRSLPISRASLPTVTRVPKVSAKTVLTPSENNEYIISGGWEMIEANKLTKTGNDISLSMKTAAWYNATVPGTVLTTLVDQGVYPDPLFGLNNLAIPDTLCRQNWWYRTSFKRPKNMKDKSITLLFNGINYEANVWLNGSLLGNIKGAFIRGEFDITKKLRDKNHLAIQIVPPPNPGIPHETSSIDPKGGNGGALCQDGPTFMCSEGWDWIPGIRDRNIGIWQDVRLKITGGSYFKDPQIITDLPLPDTTKAMLSLRTEVFAAQSGTYTIKMDVNGQLTSKKIQLTKGVQTVELSHQDFGTLIIDNPKLWWPNGYGSQPLYNATLSIKGLGNKVLDQQTVRFGIRELSYDMNYAASETSFERVNFNPTKFSQKYQTGIFDNIKRVKAVGQVHFPTLYENIDPNDLKELKNDDNPYLKVKVNGQPIFCKGGNWGMDDAMKRISRDRMEPYFKLHKDANYTIIRNWVGQSTSKVFYDLADEYGMLVWNDFWMTTQFYNMPPNDHDLLLKNAKDVVKRYVNHPSIMIWCARNEGYAPATMEKKIADLIAIEDGTRLYLSNSRETNLRGSGPWHYLEPSRYYHDIANGFTTEVGTNSFATSETLKAGMSKEDAWPISEAWYYHDLHTGHEDFIAAANDFGHSYSVEDLLERSQIINYNSHRAIYEAWNNKLWEDATGIMLWMTHSSWFSMIWQTYTYDYETHGAYFGAKKACEPVHIQMNLHDRNVVAINTTLQSYPKVSVKASTLDVHGNVLSSKDTILSLNQNSKVDCFNFYNKYDNPDFAYYFTKLEMRAPTGELLSENQYIHSTRWHQQYQTMALLDKVDMKISQSLTLTDGKVTGSIVLKNTNDVLAFSVKLNARHGATNERILPAYFSDGYFSVFPNEEKEIQVEFNIEEGKDLEDYTITLDGYNVEQTIKL